MIDTSLTAFLEGGVGIHIASRDEALFPKGARALAVRVDEGGRELIVFLSTAAAQRIVPDLEANGQVAVGFGRPVDDRACQVKGVFVGSRPAVESERDIVTTQWNGFLDQLEQIGIPRAATGAWPTWPAVAIRLRVNALFNQTPGPGAGTPIA